MSEDTIETLSNMVLQHVTIEDPRHQSGLLDLPNELLIPILKGLSESELLSLIFLSRRLHFIGLPMYLARVQVLDDRAHFSTDKISLSADNFSAALCLLQRSLCITSLTRLTCQFPGNQAHVLEDVRNVRRFVSKLSTVNEVNLDFQRYYSRQSDVKLIEWSNAFEGLLKTLSEKSCTVLAIKHGDQPANAFIPMGSNPFLKKRPRLVARPFIAIKNIGKHRDPTSITLPSDFAKAMFPIAALDGSQMTSLSLEFIRIGPEPWAAILLNLTLPKLSDLRIRCSSIAAVDLSNFLSRHPLITTLDLTWVSFPYPPTFRSPKSILPNVKEISAGLDTVTHLISAKLPNLESISIPLTFIFTKINAQMKAIGVALEDIANKKNDIALHFAISIDFDAGDGELISAAHKVATNNDQERWQSLVKSIVLNVNVQHPALTEGAVKFLPPWLGFYFRSLEHVSVGYDCVCFHCPYHRIALGSCHALTQMVRSACPKIKTVTINGLTYALD